MLRGFDGVVKTGTGPTDLVKVQSWNIDAQADTVEGWGMGDTWATTYGTVSRWSGSVEFYLPSDGMPSDLVTGTTIALELYPGGEVSGTGYWSGDAVVTGTPSQGAKDGIPTVTFNFAGTGTLTNTTVAP